MLRDGTPGQHLFLVMDTATFTVFGVAVLDVLAPAPNRGATGLALDLFLTEALGVRGLSGLPPTYRHWPS